MRDASTAWLVEIEDAIGHIRAFTQDLDGPAFVADARTCAATAMYLMVIGEASRRLPASVQGEAPEIPWPMIVSLRNRIAHGYRSIDHQIVWEIVDTCVDGPFGARRIFDVDAWRVVGC